MFLIHIKINQVYKTVFIIIALALTFEVKYTQLT